MSSRPGRKFWIAVADISGCGHQHQSPDQARNCGINLLQRHPTLDQVRIQKVSRRLLNPENVRFETVEYLTRKVENAVPASA